MDFPIFENMMNSVDGALAGIIALYSSVIGIISGPLRVGVTIYIILLGARSCAVRSNIPLGNLCIAR